MRISLLLSTLLTACAQAQLSELPPPIYNKGQDEGKDGNYPHYEFKTFKENVKPPKVNWLHWQPECDDGLYYFLTPRGWSLMHQPGPMILDARGNLVWAQHYEGINRFGSEGYNFLVQPYRGKDHLTFWIGEDRVKGHGAGLHYFVNESYDIVDKYKGANNMFADLHEFLVTDDGKTAVMTLYQIVPKDVTDFREFYPDRDPKDRDPNFVWDGVVQEIDLKTHEAVWQWRSTENVDLHDTYKPIHDDGNHENPWDWFHINSVQKDEFNNYLISSRFTQTLYYIDGRTKKALWRLGGKRNSFMDLSGGNATNFAWQHDARFHPLDTFPQTYRPPPQRKGYTTKLMTFFDNAGENQNYTYGLPLSRGLLVELTFPAPGTDRARDGAEKLDKQHDPPDPSIDDINLAKVLAINGTDPDYTVRVIRSFDNPNNIRASSQGGMQLLPQGPGKDPRILVGYGLDAAWTIFSSDGEVLCDAHYGAKTKFETGDMQSYRTYKFPWTGRPKWKPTVLLEGSKIIVSWLGATGVEQWSLQTAPTNTTNERPWREITRVRKVWFEETFDVPRDKGRIAFFRLVALDKDGKRVDGGVSEVMKTGLSEGYFTDSPGPDWMMIFLIVACVTVFFVVVYAVRRFYPKSVWWRQEQEYQLVEQERDEDEDED